jgi:hypothetical protein
MLVRVIVENFLSFGEKQEFRLLGNRKSKQMPTHYQAHNGLKMLRFGAIYGANASGKSNFIKAIEVIFSIINFDEIPKQLNYTKSKSNPLDIQENISQKFLIEVFLENELLAYQIEINHNVIVKEELILSGEGKKQDQVIFQRITNSNGSSELLVDEVKDPTEELKNYIKFLGMSLKSNKTFLKMIFDIPNTDNFPHIKRLSEWVSTNCLIVYPASQPNSIIKLLQSNGKFLEFAHNVFRNLGLGVSRFEIKEMSLDEFYEKGNSINGEKSKKISGDLILKDTRRIGAEINIEQADGKPVVKLIQLFHEKDGEENSIPFELTEESDGTARLFNLLPAFFSVIYESTTVIIDEIERSIHPVLMVKLLKWISIQPEISGQLIFSTHESNLLDSSILRHDEIWFSEKNQTGNTILYSLAAFKEHLTIDIRKGYLSGRYGSVPVLTEFLGGDD